MYIVRTLYFLLFFSDSGQHHNIHVNFDTIFDHVTFLRWKICCIKKNMVIIKKGINFFYIYIKIRT